MQVGILGDVCSNEAGLQPMVILGSQYPWFGYESVCVEKIKFGLIQIWIAAVGLMISWLFPSKKLLSTALSPEYLNLLVIYGACSI